MIKSMDNKQQIEAILAELKYTDYKWVNPQTFIVSQWVRMKCRFGCSEYGKNAACPPQLPSVSECREFFNEYSDGLILHFEGLMDKPEDRHTWSAKINKGLLELERQVFISGNERTFLMAMDSCGYCKECTGLRETCKLPKMARPSPEGMAIDVYSTVRNVGYTVNVLPDMDKKMDRFAFLLIT